MIRQNENKKEVVRLKYMYLHYYEYRSTIIQVITNGLLSLLKVLDTSTRPSLRLNSLD